MQGHAKITGSTSTNQGAAIWVDGGFGTATVRMSGNAEISNNHSTSSDGGGAVIINQGGSFYMSDYAKITGNSVYTDNSSNDLIMGGGVLIKGGSLEMSGNSSIDSNHANYTGGATINAYGGGVALMSGVLRIDNRARISANGVNNSGGGAAAYPNVYNVPFGVGYLGTFTTGGSPDVPY